MNLATEKEDDKAESIAGTNSSEAEEARYPEPEGYARGMEQNEVNDAKGRTCQPQGDEDREPFVGMEFESEDAAKKFYMNYARRSGFVVRIMQRRRSEIDGRTLARRLGCNKQGFSPNHQGDIGPNKKPRSSAREGCQATILMKLEKSGKWVVTRFVKDHNHPLVISPHGITGRCDKDKKIEELTRELQHQDELCSLYRRRLLNFLAAVEDQSDHLSSKIQDVVENVRNFEAELQKLSHHR